MTAPPLHETRQRVADTLLGHREIANDVHHFAVDGRGLVSEIMTQRFARGGDTENCDDHAARDCKPAIHTLTMARYAIAPIVAKDGGLHSTRTCFRS